MNRVLLDTNIVLDIALASRPHHIAALIVLDEIETREAEAYLCATSIKDIYYVLCKQFEELYVRQFLKAFMGIANVLPVTGALCHDALDSDEPDVEDGIIRACAEANRIDFIISRDKAAFKSSTVRCLSADEYVRLFVPLEKCSLVNEGNKP